MKTQNPRFRLPSHIPSQLNLTLHSGTKVVASDFLARSGVFDVPVNMRNVSSYFERNRY
jgi:hypothetical protein